jgi:GT2 family glycosyltransferase
LPIAYVFEAKQGLGSARNAGLAHARGEIIAMTDDDCIVDADWIAKICQEFAADPRLGLIGGRVELYDDRDLPVGIRTSRVRQVFDPVSLFNLIVGCNMAFRRSAVDLVGSFDPHFGAGSKLHSAEDCDFIYRTAGAGFNVMYCPDPLVYHHHGRRTPEERDKLVRSYRIGRGAFYAKHILQNDRRVLRMAYWEARGLLRAIAGNLVHLKAATAEFRALQHIGMGLIAYPWALFRAHAPGP